MRLILTLAGGGPSVPDKDRMRTLSGGSLSIGRGADNGWVLPDPDRSLSKTHCAITSEGGRFILTDLSTNGVYVNGAQQATERDSRIILTDGDGFRVGDFDIKVTLVDDGQAAGQGTYASGHERDPFGGGSFAGGREGRGPLDIDPLDDPLGRPPNPGFQHPIAHVATSLRGADPFDTDAPRPARRLEPDDDLFRGITPSPDWQGAPRGDHAPATSQAIPPPRVLPQMPAGEVDFDALIGDLKMPGAAPAPSPMAPSPMAPPPMAHPVQPAALRPADRDPFAEPDPLLKAAPPRPAWPDEPTLMGAAPESVAPPPHSPVTPAPVVAVAAAPVAAAPPPAPPAAAAGPDARAALAAFLDGAGVTDHRMDNADSEAALRAAGRIFRAMTEGVRDVLISRAAIKSEMRLGQTMIAAHGNNVLKFSVTADDAVGGLLGPRRAGYMEPLAAAKEAFDDIKSHEIAVMAGVQTALLGLLARFDPDELEKRLGAGGLASVLPGARKARYWDAFRLTYGDISREAEDDFQAVFGRNFAKAYSAQTRKE